MITGSNGKFFSLLLIEYEEEEKRRLASQLKDYEKQLERETENEKAKQERSIEELKQRKDELIRKQREKIKGDISKASQEGASKDEQERLLDEHNKNLEKLVNKIDADKLRMESHLQVRPLQLLIIIIMASQVLFTFTCFYFV